MAVFLTRKNVARRTLDASFGGMTVQSDARECDINHIMARYRQTGILPLKFLRGKKGFYADVSEFGDYRDCLDKVHSAERLFMSLPAELRDEFRNDPARFLEFASNPENAEKLVELGLAEEFVDDQKAKVAAAKSSKSGSGDPVVAPNTQAKGSPDPVTKA